MKLRLLWLAALAFLPVATAQAAEPYVPEPLKPWQAWVLHGEDARLCPSLPDGGDHPERLCAWPEPLNLELSASGGRFSQDWRLYAEGWVPLPGGEHWPQAVTVNGQPVPVVEHQGRPALFLAAGEQRIAGEFQWTRQPERLAVPTQSALLRLTLDGKPVAWPEREAGELWLGRRQDEKKEAEALEVQIFRHLRDAHPIVLITHLELNVSGPGREILLDQVSLPGFLPQSVAGELPARLEPDGRLRVQVRPGTWSLGVTVRAAEPVSQFVLPQGETVKEEVWSFSGDERVRISSLEGGTAVDPGEAGVPGLWLALPAYRVQPGQTLSLVERSRGLAAQDANQLSLNRQMWLAFDGSGYVLKDQISGRMHQGWRLDMRAPYVLRQGSAGGDELLVTEGGEGLSGVELREPGLDLETLAEVPAREARRATGWAQLFNGVETTLHLPPGYRLFAAPGADAAPEAWLSRWTLWDFFLVLVIAVATAKLLGWAWGALGLLLLGLTLHEPGAPQWLWLNLVAAVALVRYLPENRFRRWIAYYRNASLALLVLFALPFVTTQLRLALYPQLESELGGPVTLGTARYDADQGQFAETPAPTAVPPGSPPAQREMELRRRAELAQERAGAAKSEAEADLVERIEATGSRIKSADLVSRYAADAKIQTGPGLPSWSWRQYRLLWSGPVAPEQELALWIVPPLALAALRLLAVALLGLLVAVFARQCFPGPRWPRLLSGGTPALGLVAALVLLPVLSAHAEAVPPQSKMQPPETPPAGILAELKRRLLEAPECTPRCVELPAARVVAVGDTLTVEMDVAALAAGPVAVPGAVDGWLPETVSVNGAAQPVLHEREALWLRVEPGLSRVVLSGPMPPADSVQLAFPDKPRHVSARGEGWEVGGLVDGLLQGKHLEFTRIKTGGASAEGWAEMTRIPAFVEVRRQLTFDRDFTVHTTVTRRAPAKAPISVAIPLLAGESVSSAEAKVEDGRVLVTLPAGEDSFSWRSFLPRNAEFQLSAAKTADFVEQWSYLASFSLHVEHEGVPTLAQNPEADDYRPEFYPLPGETLKLKISRPKASAGDTLAIDSATLNATVGQRAAELSLDLAYRSSRGGQHTLALPPDAEVSEVLADGKRLGLRPDQGKLMLPIQPGSHRLSVNWRQNGEIGLRQGMPAVDLQHPASNLSLNLNLPSDRWVLWVAGPRLGPAVLYWGELAVFILVAFALGRTQLTPLRTHHWLLLGLGLSTLFWPTLALVAAWLFVLAWRGRLSEPQSSRSFNVMQLFLGFLSLAALIALLAAIPQGLLATPDMHIVGNNSYGGALRWFGDATEGPLPMAYAISLPLWVYKLAMLAWSLWLSFALLNWLRWGWGCFTAGGLWQAPPAKAVPPAQARVESSREDV